MTDLFKQALGGISGGRVLDVATHEGGFVRKGSSPMERDRFTEIVLDNLSRYPLAREADLYKLAHQAALGSEHAVENVSAAREWLARELKEIAGGLSEPLVDPISADGRIVRVHLVPYVAAGGDPKALLQAFVRTANEFRGSVEQLGRYWETIEGMAESGEIHYPTASLRSFFRERAHQGFPAVHHSPHYEAAYRPAYRVVAREFLPSRLEASA